MVSLVGATLGATAAFLIYYSLYGILLLLSADCPKGMKAKAALSIGAALLLATGLLFGAHRLGEAWEKVEEEFASSPLYSTDRFAHAEESRFWAQRAMTTAVAVSILFPLIFVWMKAGTLGPLESKCTLKKGTVFAQARDALKSLEFLVYGVAIMLAVSLYSALKNWRAFRASDKQAERIEKVQHREQAMEEARERRIARFGQGRGALNQGYDDYDESPRATLHRAFKEAAPLTAASTALAWHGARAAGRGVGRAARGLHGAVVGRRPQVAADHQLPEPTVTPRAQVHHGFGLPPGAPQPPVAAPSGSASATRPTNSAGATSSARSTGSAGPHSAVSAGRFWQTRTAMYRPSSDGRRPDGPSSV